MTDDSPDIGLDDIATQDDLADLRDALDDLESQIPEDVPEIDPDDVLTKDDIPEHVAPETERQFKEYFEHLAGDDCDDPLCSDIREHMGLAPDDDDGDDSDESDATDGDADDDGDGDADGGADADAENDPGGSGADGEDDNLAHFYRGDDDE